LIFKFAPFFVENIRHPSNAVLARLKEYSTLSVLEYLPNMLLIKITDNYEWGMNAKRKASLLI